MNLAYQRKYDFTVRVSLKVIRLAQLLPYNLVVVDLSVDGKSQRAITAHERLSTGVWAS